MGRAALALPWRRRSARPAGRPLDSAGADQRRRLFAFIKSTSRPFGPSDSTCPNWRIDGLPVGSREVLAREEDKGGGHTSSEALKKQQEVRIPLNAVPNHRLHRKGYET